MQRAPTCYRCHAWPCRCGDGITLICGEALKTLGALEPIGAAALITDPPYSSGALHAGGRRSQTPTRKYQSTSAKKCYHDYSGDNRDQRSWILWTSLWIQESLRHLTRGGYLLCFSDWRQLPALTDALQAGGALWRGIVPWDKTEAARAPHKGYFRHQAEYLAWATAGALKPATHAGPYPGVYRARIKPSEKLHVNAKPLELLEQLVEIVPPGGLVLDLFAGSGTTGLAARRKGRRALLVELSEEICETTATRLA